MARVREDTSEAISSGSGRNPFSGSAAVIHRPAVVEDGRGRPQRVVGRGQQHFVARVEQRAQAEVDQFAHAVADEHPLRRRIGRAALAMEVGDRLARRGQALLVRVRIGAGDVVGDGALQVFRRAEAEGPGVADVQLDQLRPWPSSSRARRASSPRIS
jgi:hypothetical protein